MNIKTPLNKLKFIGNILPKMDNRGALLIPLSLKVKDLEFAHYRHIPINWNIEAVMPKCLPKDFSKNAVKIVDMFRRKTIDLDYEIMLIFDYKTAELLYCFVNEEVVAMRFLVKLTRKFSLDMTLQLSTIIQRIMDLPLQMKIFRFWI